MDPTTAWIMFLSALLALVTAIIKNVTAMHLHVSERTKADRDARIPAAVSQISTLHHHTIKFWKWIMLFNLLVSWVSLAALLWLAYSRGSRPVTVLDAVAIGLLFLNMVTFYLVRP